MSRIRGADTKPEIQVRTLLHGLGFRYRLHRKDLPGKPDLVFPRYRAVVFVNGCFWHGHDCEYFQLPQTRREFWKEKISATRDRDLRQLSELDDLGWRHMTIWECALRGKGRLELDDLGELVARWLKSDSRVLEIRGTQVAA